MSVADKYKKQRDEQTALVAELRAQLAEAERERDELLRIINKPNTLTCVYCGHEYPPGSPTHGASVLTEHIKACPQHPMRAAEARAAAAMALLKRVGESCDLSLNYATFPIHLWRELRAAFYDDAALAGNGPSGPKALSVDAAADERMERLRAAQPKELVSRLSALRLLRERRDRYNATDGDTNAMMDMLEALDSLLDDAPATSAQSTGGSNALNVAVGAVLGAGVGGTLLGVVGAACGATLGAAIGANAPALAAPTSPAPDAALDKERG